MKYVFGLGWEGRLSKKARGLRQKLVGIAWRQISTCRPGAASCKTANLLVKTNTEVATYLQTEPSSNKCDKIGVAKK